MEWFKSPEVLPICWECADRVEFLEIIYRGKDGDYTCSKCKKKFKIQRNMSSEDSHRNKALDSISAGILSLVGQLTTSLEWFKSHANLATKQDLRDMEGRIMSAISDFAAKQNAFNDRQDAAIEGLKGDVKTLNDKIEALQNSSGAITPEDQALLDAIEARGDAITQKLEALDAMTPPTPPTV